MQLVAAAEDLEVTVLGDRVAIGGEIDLANADAFGAVLFSLDNAGCPARVDLSGITFMSAAGLHQILRAAGAMERTGLVIVSPSRPVRRVLELIGLESAPDLSIEP